MSVHVAPRRWACRSCCCDAALPRRGLGKRTSHPRVPRPAPSCPALQLQRALRILGVDMTCSEVALLISEVDANGDGEVRAAAEGRQGGRAGRRAALLVAGCFPCLARVAAGWAMMRHLGPTLLRLRGCCLAAWQWQARRADGCQPLSRGPSTLGHLNAAAPTVPPCPACRSADLLR